MLQLKQNKIRNFMHIEKISNSSNTFNYVNDTLDSTSNFSLDSASAAIKELHPASWSLSETSRFSCEPFMGVMGIIARHNQIYTVTWDHHEQWICDPVGVVAQSNNRSFVTIDGIDYEKYEYGNEQVNGCVYSNRNIQFLIFSHN